MGRFNYMNNKIFTDFYFSKDLEIHSIDEVQREYEEKKWRYFKIYR